MANPRRSSYASNSENPFQVQTFSMLSSLKHFLKKPHALPFLLSIFLFLAWVCLRLQHSSHSSSSVYLRGIQERKWSKVDDEAANLARFPSGSAPSPIVKDKRGWLLNPVSLALDCGIQGNAFICRNA
uniref:Uncharacterized protein MANES_09G001600 n=1 Tax=Rhizophora mucronata TaxID=61149 RepID=A0A2P2IXV9_RHIMU